MFKIGDFSKLSQVSIKTLRYYDEIGLLRPGEIDRFTGYRYYAAGQAQRGQRGGSRRKGVRASSRAST